MNKIIVFSISIIFLLATGCSFAGSQNLTVPKMNVNKITTIEHTKEQNNLSDEISNYLVEKLSFTSIGGKVFEAHELYGTEEVDGQTLAYIWSRQQEFDYKDGSLIEGSGSSMPMVIILEKKGQTYDVVNFMTPKDGAAYFSSIKELFPEKYVDKILSRTNANDLEQIVKQKAENHFSVLKKGEEIKEEQGSKAKDGVEIKAVGYFEGQIDNNSIEICILQTSGEKAPMAFRFSDSTKQIFEKLSLERGDEVEIDYVINGYNQNVIMSLKKIKK
jgi:hypothetical protein